MHYQHVGIGSLVQSSANDYTEAIIKSGESATNSGTFTLTEAIEVEFIPDAFGKDKHGGSVWDCKEFDFHVNLPVEIEAGQVNSKQYGIHSDSEVRTTEIRPDDKDYVAGVVEFVETTTGAAGEIVQDRRNLITRYKFPQELIDGNTYGLLLTKAQYKLYMDGGGNAAVFTLRAGMLARRVIVPLTEVFFDRETIAGLLDAVILDSLLG